MRGLASWRVDKRGDTNGAPTKRTLSVVVRQCKGSVQGVRTDPRCRTLRGVGSFDNGASQEPNSWNITISLCQKKSSRSPRGLSASTLRVASFMLSPRSMWRRGAVRVVVAWQQAWRRHRPRARRVVRLDTAEYARLPILPCIPTRVHYMITNIFMYI